MHEILDTIVQNGKALENLVLRVNEDRLLRTRLNVAALQSSEQLYEGLCQGEHTGRQDSDGQDAEDVNCKQVHGMSLVQIGHSGVPVDERQASVPPDANLDGSVLV